MVNNTACLNLKYIHPQFEQIKTKTNSFLTFTSFHLRLKYPFIFCPNQIMSVYLYAELKPSSNTTYWSKVVFDRWCIVFDVGTPFHCLISLFIASCLQIKKHADWFILISSHWVNRQMVFSNGSRIVCCTNAEYFSDIFVS